MIVVDKKTGEATKVKTRLKVNDEVVVISGKSRKQKGLIMAMKNNRVWVKGVNLRKRFIRPTQEAPNGGVIEVENSIHISNVQAWDPKAKKCSRLRIEVRDNKKVRVLVASGTVLE